MDCGLGFGLCWCLLFGLWALGFAGFGVYLLWVVLWCLLFRCNCSSVLGVDCLECLVALCL